MAEWTFFVYVGEDGAEHLSDWLATLPKKAEEKIRYILFSQRIFETFDERFCRPYRGRKGLYELRFKWSGNEYRLLGCFGPGSKNQFTIVEWVQKNGKMPPAAIGRAIDRIQIVRTDGRRLREFRIY